MDIKYLLNGKIKETNASNEDLIIEESNEKNHHLGSIKALKDLQLIEARQSMSHPLPNGNQYFINGYQSWTNTTVGDLSLKEIDVNRFPKFLLKKLPVQRYGDYEFYKYNKNKLHSYDVFYSEGQAGIGVINNIPKHAFLIIELLKKENIINFISDVEYLSLKENEETIIFDYEIYSSKEETIKAFNEKYPLLNKEKIYGYTSWYNYYQDINEEIILRDLVGLDNRFNLFQIDDGYETFVGDWLDIDIKKFPHGLKPIVDSIHAKGLKAGIWLAPIVAEKNSKVFKEHPEWFKKDQKGNPIQTGINWSGQYIMDLENEEVIAYIRKCLEFYMDMGFDFFKLDFLYSSNCGELKTTRAETSEKTYQMLRNILKDKLILGCGATIFNSYKNFDYLRIGPDMSLSFDDAFWMRGLHRERPSTKNTIQNTISRHIFNDRLFGNDPDVFLLRDTNIKLSKEQKRALAIINALFGHVYMNSDDMNTYSDEAKKILKHCEELFFHAEDVTFTNEGKFIKVQYTLNKEEHGFTYDKNKGVMSNER